MIKANFNHIKREKSWSILIVILFAILGYTATFIFLSTNYRQPGTDKSVVVIRDFSDNILHEVSTDTLTPAEKLRVQKVDIPKQDLLFNLNPNLLVWTTLILIMVTIASACLPVFAWMIARLRKTFRLEARHVLQSFLFACAIIGFLIIVQYSLSGFYYPTQIINGFWILFEHGWVVRTISIGTQILQIPILILISLVGISADTIVCDIRDKQSVEKAISQFAILNQSLVGALQVLAVLVVFSVLTTGALQQTIKSVLVIKGFDIFPKELSYMYGMMFSLFLGIIYIPTYLYLKNRFDKITRSVQTGIEAESEETQEWFKKILGSVNFQGSALDNLKLAFTILAPLISGFLPEQLKLFS